MRLQSGAREPVSDADLDEAAHFSKFAFAAYGYMLYVWSKPQWKCAPCSATAVSMRGVLSVLQVADAERAANRVWSKSWRRASRASPISYDLFL